MDQSQNNSLLEELEESYEWSEDAPGTVRDLLAQLPETSATEAQRARLTLLAVDDLVSDRGAAGAALLVAAVRDRATVDGDRSLQARAEGALSVLLRKIGDSSRALEHAVAARAFDSEELDPALRCRLVLALADALDECGSPVEARSRYQEALGHASRLSTPWLSLKVLNNWAYAELLLGDRAAALGVVERIQALAAEHDTRPNLVTAGTIAEILHVVGRSGEAVGMLQGALQDDRGHTPVDGAGAWLTLTRIQRETGVLDAAGQSLDTAERLAHEQEWRGLQVAALGERAELLAAAGDGLGAFALHRRFHHETLELRSQAVEARAQTLNAMLEVDAARRESARYREMSYRDPLTGLFNRRFVDEDLDRRLSRGNLAADASSATVALALVDLDHFKRVNDTLSHEAGDAVLVRLAALLTSAVGGVSDAYAARLGGEEFLLVLPGANLRDAQQLAEDLRRRIAGLDWSSHAPGVPITVSIGVAASPRPSQPLPDRADLLREADLHLYAAKDAGRNRVEPPG